MLGNKTELGDCGLPRSPAVFALSLSCTDRLRSIPGHRALCGPREAKIRMRPPLVTGEMKET